MTIQQAPEKSGIPYDTFGVRLRLARVHAGDISIDKAAELCAVKPATWSTWERGVHRPPHFEAMVKAIAAGLDVDEAWLRDGGPLMPEPPSTPPRPITLGDVPSRRAPRKSATRRNSVYCSTLSGDMVSQTRQAA